jgi:hypothetical protein
MDKRLVVEIQAIREWLIFKQEIKRLKTVFTGDTGDEIMDGLKRENLYLCPGCPYLDKCKAQCRERAPLSAFERGRIELYRIDALFDC